MSAGHDILPPWSHLRKEQSNITPQHFSLHEPHIGIYFPLLPSIKLTAERIIQNLSDKVFINSSMSIKLGFGGNI